ncbi:MAG: MFS transporter [bacterium]
MSAEDVAAPAEAAVGRGVQATYIAFIASGFAFASWASRIPQVRDQLDLNPSQLGVVLLAVAAGSLVALPLAGAVVARYGSARTVAAMSLLLSASVVVVALGYLQGVVPVMIGLAGLGFGNGAWDVAMNVQGAEVERRLGRSIMSRFHAGFSLGTVAGAGIGAAMVALHVPVTAHLLGVAAVIAASVPAATSGFLPDVAQDTSSATAAEDGGRSHLSAWREPRTLLVGVFVLCFAFVEGTGNDWIGVAMIDGYGTAAAIGTLGFALFLAAMTLGRWFGPGLLDRYGRVPTLRVLTGIGVVGLLLFVYGPTVATAFAGAILWGLGASLGFPVGMSAAADEPRYAASRVSVVASVGYVAFLAGPPLIGFLGDRYSVLSALTVAAGLLALAATIVTVLRPRITT